MQRDMSYGLAVVLRVCEARELDGLEAFLAPCRCVPGRHPPSPQAVRLGHGCWSWAAVQWEKEEAAARL